MVVKSQKMTRWHGTNYLVHLPSQNDVIVDIDVEEELNERVFGGDLLSYGIEIVPKYI